MAGLTPEEQHFFDNGGDTSKLGIDPIPDAPIAAPPPAPVDLAGLGNADPAPAPVAPVVAQPLPTTPVVAHQPPQPDQSEFLRQQLTQAQNQAAQLAAQLEAAQRTKVVEPPAPDPETDPLGSMLHQLDNVNKRVLELQTNLNEQQSQNQQLTAFNRFQEQVKNLRDSFQVTNTDFPEAYNHVRNARLSDLRAMGLDEATATRTIFQEEVALSQAAIQQGKNPAEMVYEMAKRHGYTKAALPAGTPAAPAAPVVPTPKLPSVKAGVESAPPQLPRTPVNEEITVASLREASDSDLNRLVSDPAAWSKIAGKDHIPL